MHSLTSLPDWLWNVRWIGDSLTHQLIQTTRSNTIINKLVSLSHPIFFGFDYILFNVLRFHIHSYLPCHTRLLLWFLLKPHACRLSLPSIQVPLQGQSFLLCFPQQINISLVAFVQLLCWYLYVVPEYTTLFSKPFKIVVAGNTIYVGFYFCLCRCKFS